MSPSSVIFLTWSSRFQPWTESFQSFCPEPSSCALRSLKYLAIGLKSAGKPCVGERWTACGCLLCRSRMCTTGFEVKAFWAGIKVPAWTQRENPSHFWAATSSEGAPDILVGTNHNDLFDSVSWVWLKDETCKALRPYNSSSRRCKRHDWQIVRPL